MTVVASVEALTELAEGEQIQVRSRQVGNRRWTKDSSGGFSRESGVVGVEFFVGYIAEGRVTRVDDSPPRPGEWYTATTNRYDYFHMAVLPDGRLQSMTFHSGTFRSDNEYEASQFDTSTQRMARVEGIPDRVLENPDSVKLIMNRYADLLATATNQLAAAQERLASKPEQKAEAPTTERVRVTVVVSGRSRIDDDVSRAGMRLPRNATFEPIIVPWSYEFQYTAVGEPGQDMCATADRERVAATLPAGVVEWDMEVSCPND